MSPDQYWEVLAPNAYKMICNYHSTLCLGIYGGQMSDGAPVVQWRGGTFANNPDQFWVGPQVG